ncbi:hypothetical protein [Chryseobacterium sp. T1]
MKGLLKIYHPDETLKYHIRNTYCKAVYINAQNILEVEIITDDSLDHVDDDSLQYNFPQLSFKISDFPINSDELQNQSFTIEDNDDESYTEVDLYDDEDAFLYQNDLKFNLDEDQNLQLFWTGEISDFYTGSDEPIVFKLKCHFKHDDIEVED